MRAVSTLTAIGIALWVAASSVHALGFGRVSNATQLGQPLNFAAVLRLDADESLPRECVSAEVQSGDNKLVAGQIRTTLETVPDSAERHVRVTTTTVIDEPVVTVSVTVGCTAKITRRFVAFIDPPLINLAQAGAAPATLPPQRNDSQVGPLLRLVEGEKPNVATPKRPERPKAVRPRPRAAAATSGPRLKLEAASGLAPQAASAAPSSLDVAVAALASAEAASANARAKEQSDQLARERERIQVLEDGLNKLRAESQATQAALATLQARLKEAESERYANPLVYGLAWLSALLALAVAVLLWRQSRGGNAAQWWTAPAPAPAPRATPTGETFSLRAPLSQLPDEPVTGAGAFEIPTIVEDDPPAAPPPATRPAPFAPSAAAPLASAVEPVRELSVEELIDLEQQAEFFIVLGQDEAAIELLMSHVRSDGGISPLPYLKLLEIYRRRGENEAYERIRDRFNRRFNAYAPDWESDLQQGRTLVDYPDTMLRLEALWSTPSRVMETLDASLFRRNKSDETFDLPAYRELLFLYSIARDLAEHGGSAPPGEVDLLLPLGDASEAEPGEFRNSDMTTLTLDLNVSHAPGDMPQAAAGAGSIDFDLTAPFKPDQTK